MTLTNTAGAESVGVRQSCKITVDFIPLGQALVNNLQGRSASARFADAAAT